MIDYQLNSRKEVSIVEFTSLERFGSLAWEFKIQGQMWSIHDVHSLKYKMRNKLRLALGYGTLRTWVRQLELILADYHCCNLV